jgi:hypothetical protein
VVSSGNGDYAIKSNICAHDGSNAILIRFKKLGATKIPYYGNILY